MSGLSNTPGLSMSSGLYGGYSGLWHGGSGLIKGTGGTPTPTPTFLNMPAMNAAMAAGVPAVLCEAGDSTTAGFCSNGPGAVANMMVQSRSYYLAAQLRTMGFEVSRDVFSFGDKNLVTSAAGLNSVYGGKLNMSGGWSYFGGVPNPWGGGLFGNGGDSSPITCTAELAWDTVQVFYRQLAGFGTLSFDRGGAAQTVSCDAAPDDLASTTLTFPLGTQPLTIKCISGFTTPLCVRLYNSATPRLVIIDNCGIGGYTTAAWKDASSGIAPFPGLKKLKAHGFSINLGLNDKNTGVAVGTYQTNYTDLANQCKSATAPGIALPPDVFLTIPNSCTAGYPADFDAPWKAAVAAAAVASSTRTALDLYAVYDPHSSFTAFFADDLHPLATGYQGLANAEAAYL